MKSIHIDPLPLKPMTNLLYLWIRHTNLHRVGPLDRPGCRSPWTSDRTVAGTSSGDTPSPGTAPRGTGGGRCPPGGYSESTASTAPHALAATPGAGTSCHDRFWGEGTCGKTQSNVDISTLDSFLFSQCIYGNVDKILLEENIKLLITSKKVH